MKRKLVIHPLLFALYPVVALMAFNIEQIAPVDAVRSLVWTVTGTAVYLLLNLFITRNWERAGLAVSLFAALFFSFGHVVRYFSQVLPWDVVYVFRVVFTIWAIGLIFGTYLVWRALRRDISGVTQFLNIVSIVTIIWPSYIVLSFVIGGLHTSNIRAGTAVTTTTPGSNNLPDIYYIILDGYGRADVLAEIYDYDNTPFLDALRQRGFTITNQSRSNYMQTTLSLASSLNFTYLDEVADEVGRESGDRVPLRNLIQNSQLTAVLQDHGYIIVAMPTSVPTTEWQQADIYLSGPEDTPLNNFENMLITNTLPGYFILSRSVLFNQHRQITLNGLQRLQESAAIPGPKFVFSHIMLPHPPFLLDSEGNYIQPPGEFNVFDGEVFGEDRQTYIEGYRGQLTYLNTLILQAVDAILASSPDLQPIIIIQGDHGPGSHFIWNSAEDTCLRERLSILNAYLVPDEVAAQLYDTITPVNSYRLLLNYLLGSDLGTLPDKNYFSHWRTPYNFIEITDDFEVSCSAN